MRLGTAHDDTGRRGAVLQRDGALWALAGERDVRALLDAGPAALEEAVAGAAPWPGARLAAPLRPGKVVAIGLNYADHVRESGMTAPAEPLIFAKFPSAVIGPDEPIVIDATLTERVDWEVELVAVIGRRLRGCDPESALKGVFGYTAGNDVSARDLQFGDGQWVRSKSLDTFCPLGPLIVTPDELGDPQDLPLRTRVNGETMQDSRTDQMIFGIAALLAHCSRAFTLEPGDVVMTGTPWGCGEFMDPRRSLSPGDVVEVEVEGIGTLRNPVVAAGTAP
jgi:5-carboxymethyl-2-hydroxymuconate isomerase